jgi:hypothetical protein
MTISAPIKKPVPRRGGKPLSPLSVALRDLPVGHCIEITDCEPRHTSKLVLLAARRTGMKLHVRTAKTGLLVWKRRNAAQKSDLVFDAPRAVRSEAIESLVNYVCRATQCTRADLVGSRRLFIFIEARQILAHLALADFKPLQIEQHLGWPHGRADNLRRSVQDRIETEPKFAARLRQLAEEIGPWITTHQQPA